MNLTPWRKRDTAIRTQDDLFDRLRDVLGTPLAGFESRLPEVFRGGAFPALEISETENDFSVTAELPGLEEEDIDVQVMGDQLVISGERKWKEEKQDEEFHRVETQYGSFHRTVPLPSGLVTEPDSVEASYDKGMLRVTFPKTEPTKARRISVGKKKS